jgi:hypothetical protein
MPRIALAVLISAVMGLVYLLVNAAALPGPAALAIRVAAIVAFVGALLALRTVPTTVHDPSQGGFGAGYWTVVAAEVVVGLGGVWILTQVLHAPRATLPWVTLVVGVHFFGLGVLWHARTQHIVGALVTLCGAAGLLAVAVGAGDAAVALLGGVLPGAVLLGAAYWGVGVARRRATGLVTGTPEQAEAPEQAETRRP